MSELLQKIFLQNKVVLKKICPLINKILILPGFTLVIKYRSIDGVN